MRGGQNRRRVAIGVERVFDDVVARDADRVNKELSREFRQRKARAHGAAVEHDGGFRVARFLDPGRKRLAVRIEQPAPQPHLARTVACPVIGGDEPGVMAVGVAEKCEVGREVEIGKITVLVRQHVRRQAQRREAEDFHRARHEMADVRQRTGFVEARDQQRFAGRLRQRGDGFGFAAAEAAFEMLDVLHKEPADLDVGERIELIEGFEDAVGIVDGDRTGKFRDQRARGFGGQRMGDRLVDRAAAHVVAKGFNTQRHAGRSYSPAV